MSSQITPFFVSMASLLALVGCAGPNLVARGIDVLWTDTDHTVNAYIANIGPVASGPFLVYFDGDEQPVSTRDRPQLRIQVESLAANSVLMLDGDFSPLASSHNESLSRVKSITLHVDAKRQAGDTDYQNNDLTTVLPSAVAGGTRIFGPLLRPEGSLDINLPTSVVAQTFKPPAAGHLVGLEITASRCTNPPTDLALTLRRGTTVLANASLPSSAFPTNCTLFPAAITGTAVGTLFFDFTAAPISVTTSTEFTLEFASVGSRYRLGMADDTTDLGNAVADGVPLPNLDLAFKWFMSP